jgi:hypothetical protein
VSNQTSSHIPTHPNDLEFDLDTIKMLMGMFDTDRSGSISFNGVFLQTVFLVLALMMNLEFSGLWKYVADWQGVFKFYDRDASGSIEGRELADALKSFGFHLRYACFGGWNISPSYLCPAQSCFAWSS